MVDYLKLAKPLLQGMGKYKLAPEMEKMQEKYHVKNIIKMAANENVFGPSQKALEAISQYSDEIFLYPEHRLKEFFQAIHETQNVPVDCLMATVGATGALNGLGDTFIVPGDEVIMSDLPYMQYPMIVRRNGGIPVEVPLDKELHMDFKSMRAAITDKTKLILICNPGNPTGVAEDSKELEKFIRSVPEDVLVVVDEAYLDFASTPGCTESMKKLVPELKNVMVLKTFSKIHAMAGLRTGYIIASPELIYVLGKGGTVSGVNKLGMVAAIASMKDDEHYKASYKFVKLGRDYLTKEFQKFGWKVYRSDANFLYVDTPYTAASVFEGLIRHGILIREFECIRVSVGTKEQNEYLVAVLKELITAGSLERKK